MMDKLGNKRIFDGAPIYGDEEICFLHKKNLFNLNKRIEIYQIQLSLFVYRKLLIAVIYVSLDRAKTWTFHPKYRYRWNGEIYGSIHSEQRCGQSLLTKLILMQLNRWWAAESEAALHTCTNHVVWMKLPFGAKCTRCEMVVFELNTFSEGEQCPWFGANWTVWLMTI